MPNFLSAAAKGVSIIGNHFIEKGKKEKLFQQQRDMWLEGEEFKDIRHFATLNQQDLISKRTAKATVLAAQIRAGADVTRSTAAREAKPSITFRGYDLPGTRKPIPGTPLETAPRAVKDVTKILTEGSVERKREEEYSTLLAHYAPLFEKLKLLEPDQRAKEFKALLEQKGDSDHVRRILQDRWTAETKKLRENSGGSQTVVPTLSSVYSNPTLRSFMNAQLREQILEERTPAFTNNYSALKKNMPNSPQYSVLASGYPALLPKEDEPHVVASLSSAEVQAKLAQYNAGTFEGTNPERSLTDNFIDELTPLLPKEIQKRTSEKRKEFISRLFINNQADSKLNKINRSVSLVSRPSAGNTKGNEKFLQAIRNVKTASSDIVQTLSSESSPFIFDTTGNVIPKFTGALGVAQEVVGAFKTYLNGQKKDAAYAIKTGTGESATNQTVTEIESLEGLKGTSHLTEAVKLLRKNQADMEEVKAKWSATEDTELKDKLQATYNFHMQKVLMVFSYARFLQGQDPRVSNQDFIFVSRALFPDIQLTPEAQREAIINGMVLLHASTVEPQLTLEAQQKWSIPRGKAGERKDMGATLPFIKDAFAEEMKKRKALAKSNPREYARKYMGVALPISTPEVEDRAREGNVGGAGIARSVTPTVSGKQPSRSTEIRNDDLLPGI